MPQLFVFMAALNDLSDSEEDTSKSSLQLFMVARAVKKMSYHGNDLQENCALLN